MSTSCLTSGGPSLPLPFLQAFESNSQAQRVQEGARAGLDAPAMGGGGGPSSRNASRHAGGENVSWGREKVLKPGDSTEGRSKPVQKPGARSLLGGEPGEAQLWRGEFMGTSTSAPGAAR